MKLIRDRAAISLSSTEEMALVDTEIDGDEHGRGEVVLSRA